MLKKLTTKKERRKLDMIRERIAAACDTCEWDCREFCSIQWSRASQTAIMESRIKI